MDDNFVIDNQELLRQFDELTERRNAIDAQVAALIQEDGWLRDKQISIMALAGIDIAGIPTVTPRKTDGTRH